MVDKIFVYEEVSGKIKGCSPEYFSTLEIIKSGVIGKDECDTKGKLKKKFTAKPGEVIVFVQYLHWWERIQE